MVSFILPGNSASGEYEVANSCRFNNDDNAELSKTPGSDGNRRKWTFSCWVKRSQISSTHEYLLSAEGETTVYFRGEILTTELYDGNNYYIRTNRVFRDPSAWYHIVCVWDTENSTEANRLRLYVNGVEETSFSASAYPTQNYDSYMNKSGNAIRIGSYVNDNDGKNFDGYMAEAVLVDGQALTPTSFGEFDEDTNIWKPIDVSGLTFGTNGFYLDFEDSSNLGNDVNGGTDFTVTNLTAIDQATDTCTNNFATMNPLDFHNNAPTLSNGNLTVAAASSNSPIRATMGFSKGKWYAEYRFEASDNDNHVGCHSLETSLTTNYTGGETYSWGFLTSSGNKRNGGVSTSYGSAVGYSNPIIMIAIDKDNGKIWWGVNGTWVASGDPANGSNEAYSNINTVVGSDGFVTFSDTTYRNGSWNFGNPIHSISSGNSDANGYGNFEYAVPSGFYSLCTKNLAEYG